MVAVDGDGDEAGSDEAIEVGEPTRVCLCLAMSSCTRMPTRDGGSLTLGSIGWVWHARGRDAEQKNTKSLLDSAG